MTHLRSIAIIATLAGLGLAACKGDKRAEQPSPAPAPASSTTSSAAAAGAEQPPAGQFAGPEDYEAPALSRIETPNGLILEELKLGEGAPALPRALVTFHYRGKIQDAHEFDATLTRPEERGGPKPEEHPLDRLMPGLSEGMVGMRAGGRRRITVPPHMARGIVGMKDIDGNVLIPPNATLIYVVDLVSLKQQLVAPGQQAPAADNAAPANTPAAPK